MPLFPRVCQRIQPKVHFSAEILWLSIILQIKPWLFFDFWIGENIVFMNSLPVTFTLPVLTCVISLELYFLHKKESKGQKDTKPTGNV